MEVSVESKTSVLIATDIPLVRSSLRELLNNTPQLEVIACAETRGEVLTLADLHRPQVAILDFAEDWNETLHLVKNLSDRRIPTLLMADAVNDGKTIELLGGGARGVISRRVDTEYFARAPGRCTR